MESNGKSTVLILVLVGALAVGVFFYVSMKGKNDTLTDAVKAVVGGAKKVIGTVTDVSNYGKAARNVVSVVPGLGGKTATLQAKIDNANKMGLIYSASGTSDGFNSGGKKLPSGMTNAIDPATGQAVVVPIGTVFRFQGITATAPSGTRLSGARPIPTGV